MALKQYIDNRAKKAAQNAFNALAQIQAQSDPNAGSLAKIASVQDGQYVAYMPDGTFQSFTPGGSGRGTGVGSMIYVINGVQIF